MGELAREGYVAVAVGVGDMWQPTHDMTWHVPHYMLHLTPNTWNIKVLIFPFYPHTVKDLVSPVRRIFSFYNPLSSLYPSYFEAGRNILLELL